VTGTNVVKYRGRLLREDSLLAFEEKWRHIEATIPRLLALLSKYNTKLTFFVTGRLYESCPEVINDIYRAGHEIGWHGHNHRPIFDTNTFIEDLAASEEFICKFKPKGFRAPWMLFHESFLPMLRKAGFVYDSSLFGPAGFQDKRHGVRVFPVTSFPNLFSDKPLYAKSSRYLNAVRAIPVGSSFFFSLFRKKYDYLLHFFETKSVSCILYLHNWQMFPWPEREMSLIRDNLRYIQKYPLGNVTEYLLCKHRFFRMDRMFTGKRPYNGHFFTFDME
jgi:hypothetical protein